MTATVWVPCDAAAVSVGADAVADALAAAGATVRRNGSRGMLWLEPLVEVETGSGRIGFSTVTPGQAGDLLAGELHGTEQDLGVVDEHPWLARQHRVSFARVGVIEPTDLAAYRAHGGLAGLERALTLTAEEVVREVTDSGLRGRGGAGFPAGIKWETVRTAQADVKFVCCNADEGDSGTFADRMLIEGDPFTLIEGMTIAAVAVGATEGYVYLRSEYPHAIRTLRRAIDIAYAHGLLGGSVLGSGHRFDLDVRVGAGAYICGEETSMLDSLEGKRGEVRAKPPIPALRGPVRQADRRQQRAHPRGRPDGPRRRRRRVRGPRHREVPRHAGLPARRQRGPRRHRRGRLRHQPARARRGLRRRHRVRPAGQGRAGRRPARGVPAAGEVRPADGLRGLRRGGRDGGARRHRRLRRVDGRRRDGPLRDGVLRQGVLRQVHPVPGRVHPRRRGHRPDPGGDAAGVQPRPARGPLHDDGQGLAVRDGRPDADAGAQRPRALARGLRRPGRARPTPSPATARSQPRAPTEEPGHDDHRRDPRRSRRSTTAPRGWPPPSPPP